MADVNEILKSYPSIAQNVEYSRSRLAKFRYALRDIEFGSKHCGVITGSYGRSEASAESDFDFYVLHESDTRRVRQIVSAVSKLAEREGFSKPSAGGHFGESQSYLELEKNIGGNQDTNASLTRRILFLLEAKGLFNQKLLDKRKRSIIRRYISDDIHKENVALYLAQ